MAKDFYEILGHRPRWDLNEYFFAMMDGFPVSPGHMLVVSKAVREDYFQLTREEKDMLPDAIDKARVIVDGYVKADGYNIGMNCGAASGQTVLHFHLHLIPRYIGDVEDPRGGVRNCMPNGNYLK